MTKEKLAVIDGETLAEMYLPPTKFSIAGRRHSRRRTEGRQVVAGVGSVHPHCKGRTRLEPADRAGHNVVPLLGGYAAACAGASVYHHG